MAIFNLIPRWTTTLWNIKVNSLTAKMASR